MTRLVGAAGRSAPYLAVVGLLLIGVSCLSHANRSTVCTGGTKKIGDQCFCPLGTQLTDGACVGEPQAGICAGGSYQVQDQCFCPDGTVWDDAAGQCLQLDCQGGSVVAGNTCVCPAGTVWQNEACEVPQCTGGAFAGDDGQCYCPGGTQWDGASCIVVAVCTGGAYAGGDGQCYCPDGTQWDGFACTAVAASCAGGAVAGADGQCYCPAGTQWDGYACSTTDYGVADVSSQEYCYDLDCNGSRTGRQCFDSKDAYCSSLCASDNCLAPDACRRNCG